MPLDKIVTHGKEHHKPYRSPKAMTAHAVIMAAVRGTKKTGNTNSGINIRLLAKKYHLKNGHNTSRNDRRRK